MLRKWACYPDGPKLMERDYYGNNTFSGHQYDVFTTGYGINTKHKLMCTLDRTRIHYREK